MIPRDAQKLLQLQRAEIRQAAERLSAAIATNGDVSSRAHAYLATLRSYRRMAQWAVEAEPDVRRSIQRAS
jgi:ABC-type transporter Mla subunit MlaD